MKRREWPQHITDCSAGVGVIQSEIIFSVSVSSKKIITSLYIEYEFGNNASALSPVHYKTKSVTQGAKICTQPLLFQVRIVPTCAGLRRGAALSNPKLKWLITLITSTLLNLIFTATEDVTANPTYRLNLTTTAPLATRRVFASRSLGSTAAVDLPLEIN